MKIYKSHGFPVSEIRRFLEPGPVSPRGRSRECVINVPTVELAREVAGIGNCSGSTVDKFEKFKLTAIPADQVKAP